MFRNGRRLSSFSALLFPLPLLAFVACQATVDPPASPDDHPIASDAEDVRRPDARADAREIGTEAGNDSASLDAGLDSAAAPDVVTDEDASSPDPDASIDTGLDAGHDAPSSAPGIPFDPSVLAQIEASGYTASQASSAAPYPYPLVPSNPEAKNLLSSYWQRFRASNAPAFKAFGALDPQSITPPAPEGYVSGASLMFAKSASDVDLARLTDFTQADGARRFALACELFLGQDPPSATDTRFDGVRKLRNACLTRGRFVSVAKVASLRTRGVKLFRNAECALPSARYGAFSETATSFSYSWPQFTSRDPQYQQPCLGVYLDVEARDKQSNLLDAGWVFGGAVADLSAVPFPYLEHDAVNGEASGADSAPRGEFVSSRWVFRNGTGLYLGQSPLYVVPRSAIRADNMLDNAVLLSEALPACTSAGLGASRPAGTACIASSQKPFVFPLHRQGVWLRQALDSRHPSYDPLTARADAELFSTVDTLPGSTGHMRRFFLGIEVASSTLGDAEAKAEQLSAMWHSWQTYRAFSEDESRHQAQVIDLDPGHVLLVPAQGYVPLGNLSSDLATTLRSTDLQTLVNAAVP